MILKDVISLIFFFTLHVYSDTAVCTFHDRSVTEGYTLHDFRIGRIDRKNSVWSPNCFIVKHT